MHLTIAILICFLWQVFSSIHEHFEFVAIAIAFFLFGIKNRIHIPKLVGIWIVLALHSFLCFMNGTLSLSNLAIQGFSVVLSYLYYYNIVQCYSAETIMKKYCKVAFGFSIFAILQEALAVLGNYSLVQLHFLVKGMKLVHIYGPLIRVEGLCSEPFNFTLLLLPAVYCGIRTYLFGDLRIYNKIQAAVVMLAYVLTFSGAGMIGLGIAVLLAVLDKKRADKMQITSLGILKGITLIAIVCLAFIWAYINIPMITIRVDDTVGVLNHTMELEKSGMSTYAIISNLKVAINEFVSTAGLGVGFGSYGSNYLNYSNVLDSSFYAFGINMLDGSGLIIRLFAELGIIGPILLIWFFSKYRMSVALKDKWISNAVLAQLLLRCIRLGNYTMFGLGLMVCIYIVVGSNGKTSIIQSVECEEEERKASA